MIERLETALARNRWVPVVLVLGFYVLTRLPEALGSVGYWRLTFPSFALYAAKHILFGESGLNSALRDTVVAPANAFFIYPPGTYLLCSILGGVRSVFLTSFVLQAGVPLLALALCRRVLSILPATLVALLLVQYGTVIQIHPDWFVQPLLIGGLLLLWPSIESGELPGTGRLAALGAVVGSVMVFKQNIGVFYLVLLITLLWACSFRNPAQVQPSSASRPLLAAVLLGYLGFGVHFARLVIHADDVAYFLAAYFLFWFAVALRLLRTRETTFDWVACFRSSLVLVAFSLLLPGAVFLWVGGLVGYGRYFHSLFGMGFDHLEVWDLGVWSLARGYFSFHLGWNLFTLLNRLLPILFFLAPLLGGMITALFVVARWRGDGVDAEYRRLLAVGTLSIMGGFLLFPLEDYRILQSKLLLFLFPLFCYLGPLCARSRAVKAGVVAALFLVLASTARGNASVLLHRPADSVLQSSLGRLIDIPVPRRLAEELDRQAAVVERSTAGQDFYVVNFGGEEMVPLLWLKPGQAPQYYVETREALLDPATVRAIIDALSTRPFVVVNRQNYSRFLEAQWEGSLSSQILGFIRDHFVEVDRYEGPELDSVVLSGVYSFVVMKRR